MPPKFNSTSNREMDSDEEGELKRANHNALERKRRDHIKDSFSVLKDAVPTIQVEKPSRSMILHRATDYIQYMKKKNEASEAEVSDLQKQNEALMEQIRSLEKNVSSS